MDVLAVTAITNFILAGEVLFLAGMLARMPKVRFSAAWFWSGSMTLLGVAALIGGIDHGFFEPQGIPRYAIQRFNWLVMGAVTFCVLMTTARQCFERWWQHIFLLGGIIQLALYTGTIALIDDYRVVMVNYTPVMVLWLALNISGLKKGTGSWEMITGILIIAAASVVQGLGVDVWSPLDRNGLYHLIAMPGVVFLYLGGQRLRSTR